MAHTKSAGSVKGNRDSISKRRGVKAYGGEKVTSGSIIVRQKGTNFHPGNGVMIGRDYTIFAVMDGKVSFKELKGRKIVEVL